jgi:serine/threonine protein kinase
LEIQKRIDALCREYERQWQRGDIPQLENLVAKMDEHWRRHLLPELLAIEIGYRRQASGQTLDNDEICALHPNLMPDCADALRVLRRSAADVGRDDQLTSRPKVLPRETAPTEDFASTPSGSRGLHIRCPHCSNPVELLADTPYESITCRTCGSAFNLVDSDARTLEAPTLQRLGRFELISRLGVGGFGTVWKARDTELDRAVAVKIPRKGQLDREEVEQFLREARTAAQLRHANIVSVHEVGRDGDTIFIVSDLVRGVSLADWLSGAAPPFRTIAELLVTVAQSLHHAHERGVIHRDLKPSNILIDEQGQPHLMDFGLAKRVVSEITMTVDGQVLGTPAYMSPEQAQGQSRWTDRRTDIYSLGVVLFRMLTGELPFRGNSQMQIHQRLTKDPPDPRTLNRFIPQDLAIICLKCLEPDPNRRYSTAKELADELVRFLRGEPIQARPVSKIERALRWARREPATAAAAMLTLILAIAGPIAAATIYYAKHRQSELLIEKNNLIDKLGREKQSDATRLDELTKQLDTWEGRANPWTFWPPQRETPPRRKLAADFYDEVKATLANKLQTGNSGTLDLARGYLALAQLAEASGQTSDAIGHYQHGLDQLKLLATKDPGSWQFTLALAECYDDLARLTAKDDRAAAEDYLAKAQDTYRQLAARKSDPRYQIDSLETELKAVMLSGTEAGLDHLARIAEISGSLSGKWPTDPAAAYRLASYLVEREPLLVAPDSDKPRAGPAP